MDCCKVFGSLVSHCTFPPTKKCQAISNKFNIWCPSTYPFLAPTIKLLSKVKVLCVAIRWLLVCLVICCPTFLVVRVPSNISVKFTTPVKAWIGPLHKFPSRNYVANMYTIFLLLQTSCNTRWSSSNSYHSCFFFKDPTLLDTSSSGKKLCGPFIYIKTREHSNLCYL